MEENGLYQLLSEHGFTISSEGDTTQFAGPELMALRHLLEHEIEMIDAETPSILGVRIERV